MMANARIVPPEIDGDDEKIALVIKGKNVNRLTEMYENLKLTREQALALDQLVMEIAEYAYQAGHANATAAVGEWPDL